MSLAVRLLLALGAVAVLVTALVGFSARRVSRSEAERGFSTRIEGAVRGARTELAWEANTLTRVLIPLCRHERRIDRLLRDLETSKGRLAPSKLSKIQTMIEEQRTSLKLDRLVVVTGRGAILAATDKRRVGTVDPSLAAEIASRAGKVRLTRTTAGGGLTSSCTRSGRSQTVGLVGTRRIEPILDRVGKAYGVTLALAERLGKTSKETVQRTRDIPEIQGLRIVAKAPRAPLTRTLQLIDKSIFLTGGIAVLLSIALAVFLARNLSRPIMELTYQTRQVVRGDPKPVEGRGGHEIQQLARSFNRTIAELTAMRERLAVTERIAARRELARQVAHEIKNPLAPIQASVETLRRLRARQDDAFDDYFNEATETVLNEVHRIKQIVTEFSEFARMPKPVFARIDLRELIRGVAQLHDGSDAEGPSVKLHSDELPPIVADRNQLVQVLTNLIQNALDATEDLGGEANIDIHLAHPTDAFVTMTVKDNGQGVPQELAPRIFEAKFSSKASGRGYGLAIVRGIIAEHGGQISLESSSGNEGACFRVELPVDGPPSLARKDHESNSTPT